MTTKPKRVVVAINPSASFGAKSAVGPAVVSTLRAMGHDVVALTEPDFPQLLAASRRAVAARPRPDAFVVVGGDGMVNLGANVLAGTKVPLGIVPSGTGNDMARTLGMPFDDTEASIRMLGERLQQPPRVMDAIRASYVDDRTGDEEERWVACALSAGFDALVNERANRMRNPKGPSRYIIALLIELTRLKPIRYRLRLDGRDEELAANLVSIGNGVSLGGGMKITPDALVDDGLMDVMIVSPLSRFNFLRLFPRVFAGTHVSVPVVRIEKVKRLRLDGDGVVVYGDGERIGPAPVDLEVVPGVLRVLAPTPAASH